jgi:beta-N-acetylhexosaminidase
VSREARQLAGQLLVVGFEGVEAPPGLLDRVRSGQLGGVVLFGRNLTGDLADLARLTTTLQRAAPADRPLLVAVDQEGGRVQRLRQPLALWPPMRRLGQLDDPQLTAAVGRALGRDLRLLGFNLDFAPVLDVVQSEVNSVIGDRSFGPTPDLVVRHGLALAQGLLERGVLPCAKHFPGHGGPVADSHQTLPRDARDARELRRVDLAPFAAALDLPLMMTAHVLYPALDPHNPATLSPAICTDLLRGELGYRGALISDDLEMAAISTGHGSGEAAVAALRAGVDLLLLCGAEDHQHQVQAALIAAAEADTGHLDRLRQAHNRLQQLRKLLPPPLHLDPAAKVSDTPI